MNILIHTINPISNFNINYIEFITVGKGKALIYEGTGYPILNNHTKDIFIYDWNNTNGFFYKNDYYK